MGFGEGPRRIGAPVTVNGTAPAGQHTPVDATSGPVALTLPTGQRASASLSVEKVDSSANAVTVTGSIRGIAGATLTLSYQYETLELRTDANGSWWVESNHLPKAAVDSKVAAQAASDAATYVTYDGTNLRKNGTVIPISGGGTLTVTDNGDGTGTFTPSGSTTLTDNGDGTGSIAA